MSHRAAVFLFQGDKIALIERHKQGVHYFTFPGGHVEAGESLEEAAVRETKEELGLDVVVQREAARMNWRGHWQHYFLVVTRGGIFGEGNGPEMSRSVQESGTYHPTWLPVSALLEQPVRPREVAELVLRCSETGWLEAPVVLTEG